MSTAATAGLCVMARNVISPISRADAACPAISAICVRAASHHIHTMYSDMRMAAAGSKNHSDG